MTGSKSTIATLLQFCKELEETQSSGNEARAIDLLKKVTRMRRQTTPVDLYKTHIGRCVNATRHMFKGSEVQRLSIALLKKWKALVDEARAQSVPEEPNRKGGSDQIEIAASDSIRRKSCKLIANALQKTADVCLKDGWLKPDDQRLFNEQSVAKLSEDIERCIFTSTGGKSNDRHYRARVRSRMINLADERNAQLVSKIIRREISPGQVATMTPEALAPEELRRLRETFEKESFRDHGLPSQSTLHSTSFLCNQCKQRDCNYSISQERLEGDYEPTEVSLIVCNKCGHRWKSY